MANWWMVNYKANESLIDFWIKNGIVTVGWSEIGNPLEYETKDKLLMRCDEVYSNVMPGKRIQYESQVWRFSREINKNDRIITYNALTKEYYIGIVLEEYRYMAEVYPKQPNVLKVKWVEKHIHEKLISKELKDSLSQNYIVFRIFNCDAEIERLLVSNGNVKEALDKENEIYNAALECIKELLKNMDKNKFKFLVRELLCIMKYKVSNNYDNDRENSYLIISEDELSFTKNIIRVCHLNDDEVVDLNTILNVLNSYGDNVNKYLIISNNSISQAIKNSINDKIFMINLSVDDIVLKLFEYYDELSEDTKKLLLLRKVYI
ncbi:restriction endonuclease [Clostridium neuense]|uniref:Restriction endonuclease n=1 Tax=Clostridium neuense TaxID=1728934 RepID=A0ABW8TEA1_9CLOT